MDDYTEKLSAKGVARWKAEQRRTLVSRVVRWGIGIPLLLFCGPIPWFGPFLMLLGAILIAPEIAGYLSGLLVSPLGPHRGGNRKPVYGIAESLVAKGRYAEAEQEYERIVEGFPAEVKPHIDMIDIAVTRLNDGELAEKLYRRGLSILRDAQTREALTRRYKEIATRLV